MVDICRGANPRYFHFKYGFKNLRRKNRENCRNNPQVWVINDAIDCLRKGNKQLLTCVFRLVQLSTEEISQSVECLTAERGIAGWIPGAGPILGVLKCLRNVGTLFAFAWLG